MIQGREFIDSESDLIQFVKQDIRRGAFNALLSYAGIGVNELVNGLDVTELYDYDYLDVEGELYTKEIFLDKCIREAILRELRIVEIFTILIQRDEESHRIVFMAVGENQIPGEPYTCYAYGFIDCTMNLKPRYYFHCLTEIKAEGGRKEDDATCITK